MVDESIERVSFRRRNGETVELPEEEGVSLESVLPRDATTLVVTIRSGVRHVLQCTALATRPIEESKEEQKKEEQKKAGLKEEESAGSKQKQEPPDYARNTRTHNYEGLMLTLHQLRIADPADVQAILRLSDYGRLGGHVWKVIHGTRWKEVSARGKYLIAALAKERRS